MEITEKKCTHKVKLEGADFHGEATITDGHITEMNITISNKGYQQENTINSEETIRGLAKEFNQLIEFLDKEKKLGHEQ